MTDKKKALLKTVWAWLRDILPAVIVSYLLFGVLFRLVIVSGDSMWPTLKNGSLVLSQHALYEPERGDIVICDPQSYGRTIIKRIIGIGGDTIDVDFESGAVYVNGEELDEPYVAEKMERNEDAVFPVTVEEGYVFVLGDNRNHSSDSRSPSIGQVPEDRIIGRYLGTILG